MSNTTLQINDKFIFDLSHLDEYNKEFKNILKKQDVYICSDIIRTSDNKVYLGFNNFPLTDKVFSYDHFVKYND